MTHLLVAGATGEMGRRVVRLAERALPGLEIVAGSRGGAAVGGASGLALDAHDPSALARALDAGAILVNAIGPYTYDPSSIVEACVAVGARYVDLAESERFVDAVAQAGARAGAKAAGVTLVPGASTVPGLLELLAHALAERVAAVERFAAWLSLGSRNPVGAGLLAGLLAPLGRARPEGGRALTRSIAHRAGDGRARRFGAWPSGLPGGAVDLTGRRVPLDFHVGFDRAGLTRALAAAAPIVRRVPESSIPALARALRPLAQLARPFGTARGSLRVEALDASHETLAAADLVAERDGLDVPAWPAVWAVEALAAGSAPPGVQRLAALVPYARAAERLAAAGFALRLEPGPVA